MNKIKDIELEIYNLGETLNPNNLLPLINKMEEFVNRSYPLPHPLLKPELVRNKFQKFREVYYPAEEESKALEYFTTAYCESCQNFILRKRDTYWSFLDIKNQKLIEYQILACSQLLKKIALEYGFVIVNLGSLESISSAEPRFDQFDSAPYLKDYEIDEFVDQKASVPKIIMVLHLSGLLDILKSALNVSQLQDLAKYLALVLRVNVRTLRRDLSALQTQINTTTVEKNTAFTKNQKLYIEEVVKTLVKLGLPKDEVISRIPPIEFGDE